VLKLNIKTIWFKKLKINKYNKMKKEKYIDIYVIMACLSHKKPKINLQAIDELLSNACEEIVSKREEINPEIVNEFSLIVK
jgi:hypothetical protein